MVLNKRTVLAAIAASALTTFSAYAEEPVETTERVQERVQSSADEGRGELERTRKENNARIQNRTRQEAEPEEPSEGPGFWARVRNAFGGDDAAPSERGEPSAVGADADRDRTRDRTDEPDQDRLRDGADEVHQDRLRDRIEDPDQERLRDRVDEPEHDRDRDRDHDRPEVDGRAGGGHR